VRLDRSLDRALIEVLDIGGGWFPEDFTKDSGEKFQKSARARFPNFCRTSAN
jgi:hypothetical protein